MRQLAPDSLRYTASTTEGDEPRGLDCIDSVAKKFREATRRDLNQLLARNAFEELGMQPEPFLHAVSLAMTNH